jgi:hypothetical protein
MNLFGVIIIKQFGYVHETVMGVIIAAAKNETGHGDMNER